VIAGTSDFEELSHCIDEIQQFVSCHELQSEIVVVRQARSISDWSSTADLLQGRSNLLVIDSVGSNGDLESAVQGLSQAIGDLVFLVEVDRGQISELPQLFAKLMNGKKLVLGLPGARKSNGVAYSIGRRAFSPLFRAVHGVDSATTVPIFRGMTREIASLILASPQPELLLRFPGLAPSEDLERIVYNPSAQARRKAGFWSAYASGMRLLLGGSRAPLRFASLLALFGAIANLIYALYVLALSAVRSDLAAGWASTSMQMSGMFFLISLVLLLISEYLLQVVPTSRYSRLTASQNFSVASDIANTPNVEKSASRESD